MNKGDHFKLDFPKVALCFLVWSEEVKGWLVKVINQQLLGLEENGIKTRLVKNYKRLKLSVFYLWNWNVDLPAVVCF